MKNIIIQLYYIINTNSRACERPLAVSGKRATAAFVTSRKLLRRRNQACQGRRRGIVFHVTLDRSRTPPQRLRIPAMQARPGCNTPTAAAAASRTTERLNLAPFRRAALRGLRLLYATLLTRYIGVLHRAPAQVACTAVKTLLHVGIPDFPRALTFVDETYIIYLLYNCVCTYCCIRLT